VFDIKTCAEEQRSRLPSIQENVSLNLNEQANHSTITSNLPSKNHVDYQKLKIGIIDFIVFETLK